MRIVNDRTVRMNTLSSELFSDVGRLLMSYPSFILLGKWGFFFSDTVIKEHLEGTANFWSQTRCVFVKRTDVLTPWAEGREVPVLNKPSGCPKKYLKPAGTLLNRDAVDPLKYLVVERRKWSLPGVKFLAFNLYKRVSSRDFANSSLRPFSIFKLVNYFHARANRRRVYWL